MTETVLTGRCFCGRVSYQCGGLLYPPTLCHCESCRRITGAHSVGWITVRADTLVFAAQPVEFSSSPRVYRTFCDRCGTPLTYRRDERAGEIDITFASLDAPEKIPPPIDHIYMEDALPWDRPADGLPHYMKTRTAR